MDHLSPLLIALCARPSSSISTVLRKSLSRNELPFGSEFSSSAKLSDFIAYDRFSRDGQDILQWICASLPICQIMTLHYLEFPFSILPGNPSRFDSSLRLGIYPQERGPSIPYFREELLGLILKGLVPLPSTKLGVPPRIRGRELLLPCGRLSLCPTLPSALCRRVFV